MHLRRFLARTTALAVLTGSPFLTAASPASAGATKAVVYAVHGIPGIRADVCVAGLGEVASRMQFATKVRLEVESGSTRIRVRRASKGECKGTLLAQARLELAAGDNVTAILRTIAGQPAIDRYTNNISPTPVGEFRLTAVHAMSSQEVDVWVNGNVEIADLQRGDSAARTFPRDDGIAVWASKVDDSDPIVGPRVFDGRAGFAFQFVMVGTKVANNKVVVFKQEVGTA
jgi:hypothetical protein